MVHLLGEAAFRWSPLRRVEQNLCERKPEVNAAGILGQIEQSLLCLNMHTLSFITLIPERGAAPRL